MRSPNSTNMSPVFPFGICFHRKVSAKAWNGISFFKRNVLTNEVSFWNIPAAVLVLLDMVERPDKTCSIYFSTRFYENLSTWKTTTPLTAILEKHAIEGHVHLLLKCFEETRIMAISFTWKFSWRLLENDRKINFLIDLFSWSRYVKRVQFFNGRYKKGVPLVKNGIHRVRDWTSGRRLSKQSFIEQSPLPPSLGLSTCKLLGSFLATSGIRATFFVSSNFCIISEQFL